MRFASKLPFWFVVNTIAMAAVLAINLSDPAFTKAPWWTDTEPVATSLLAGGLVSFLFYFLVVHLPERRQRSIIKTNLRSVYRQIKRDIARQIIFASQKGGRTDLQADQDTIDKLMTVDGSRATFDGGREGHEGFYAFRNYIGDDVPEYREIILSLRMLAKQIDFVLHNYPITDPEIFGFFKRLEMFLLRIQGIGPGYEEEKVLSKFIWEIYGGWNWIDGERDHDIVERMIDNI